VLASGALRHFPGVVFVLLIAAVVFLTAGAGATPTPFSLTFTGSHVSDSTLGLRHEGRFTASSPFCPAGSARDVRHLTEDPLSVLRTHTCDDGSGTITVSMPLVRAEHGGRGSWRITEGTGKYATLRGSGSYVGELVSGDPDDFASISYRTTWTGKVDFDAAAPVVGIAATAIKLKLPRRAYSLRVMLVVRNEEAAARVAYSLSVKSGAVSVASRQGVTTGGRATLSLRISPPRTARAVRLIVTASDPVGNESTTTRSIRLP
jgi:hypothetical protein